MKLPENKAIKLISYWRRKGFDVRIVAGRIMIIKKR